MTDRPSLYRFVVALGRISADPQGRNGHVALPMHALSPAPPDPILGLSESFRADTRLEKVNLSVGVYIDATGNTPLLPTVVEAERRLIAKASAKSYLPIDGRPGFKGAVRDLVFGDGTEIVVSGRSETAHTPGGTGALRVAADFLVQNGASRTIWMSDPTWPNHPQLFTLAGFTLKHYPYLDESGRHVDKSRLLNALRQTKPGEVVLLQGSCHNPSGVDPDPALWEDIADVVVERELFPIVDFAYQGFGHGLREDADWLMALSRPGLEFLVCSSFSKNFALYNERVGAITVVAADRTRAAAALTHLKIAIRANYSNPPSHGGDIVETILCDEELRARWLIELAAMRGRIQGNRAKLVDALVAARVPGDWEPIRTQRGMFALLNLNPEQVARLRDEFAIYVVTHGRINVAGLTDANLPRVVDAIGKVLA